MPQARKYANPAQRQAAYRARQETARQLQLAARSLPVLPAISTMPGVPRWRAALRNAQDILSMVAAEMASYFDDRSELWQESDRGEAHLERQEAIEALAEALSDFG